MDEFVRKPKRQRIFLGDTQPGRTNPSINQPDTTLLGPPEPRPQSPQLPQNWGESGAVQVPGPPKSRFPWIRKPRNRKQWFIFILITLLILGGIGFAVYWFALREEPEIAQAPAPVQQIIPTTVASKVSGMQVEPEVNTRPVFAVQIENSGEARPQSGLINADVVFEAVAEGGITRFNALFHDSQPKNIGPIRSLRPYYIDWFWPFDAAIVHAGGSPEALSDVRSLNLKDIEHGVNGSSFRRISSRYSPHNLYSTSSDLLSAMSKRGYTTSNVTSFLRKEPAPAETPTASTINLKISSALYNVSYKYDKENNRYKRSQGGAAHKDADNGKQITATTVIVPVMKKSIHPDGVHTKYGTTGSGKVYIFQDGTVTVGTWKKDSRKGQWKFVDSTGKDIALNPGKTWVTMIDSAASVSYKP